MREMTEQDIINIIAEDIWRMDVLRAARSLHLHDWWIGAGFVRNKVWDTLHGYSNPTLLGDVDVIYFDSQNIEESHEKELDRILTDQRPEVPWSVKNQARFFRDTDHQHYSSVVESISEWPETATSVATTLDDSNQLHLLAPHGIDDLINLRVCPTPSFMKQRLKYEQRQAKKAWAKKWPNLTFYRFPD